MLNLNHIYGCVLNFNLILLIIYNYIVDFLETVKFYILLKTYNNICYNIFIGEQKYGRKRNKSVKRRFCKNDKRWCYYGCGEC